MYAGEQFDKVTGEYYLRARYYDPVIGRFTQEDTYRGDGPNLYAYVGNNPVNAWDPSGHKIALSQTGKVLEGIGARIKDEVIGLASLADPAKIAIDGMILALEVANGDISLEDLLDLGVKELTEDIRYVQEHSYVRDCKTYVSSDEEVFWFEYHSAGAVMDILGLLIGGEKIALKVTEILSKSKAGKKILKVAEDIEKAAKSLKFGSDAKSAEKLAR